MDLGHELVKEQLFFRKEMMERVSWMIRLRWMAIAAGFSGCLVGYVAGWPLPAIPVSLIFIFITYALTDSKFLVSILYIIDHILFNFSIAIRTYFQKIGDTADIAPSMAMGFTINHIAAVFIPAIGGILWMLDYRIPFYAGAVLSLISLIAVQWIKTHQPVTTS